MHAYIYSLKRQNCFRNVTSVTTEFCDLLFIIYCNPEMQERNAFTIPSAFNNILKFIIYFNSIILKYIYIPPRITK